MANWETEVKEYSSGSTYCIEKSILNITPDTCIPIRDRTREEITDLPEYFLKKNSCTVPLKALNASDTVEKELGTRRCVLKGELTVPMVTDNDRIKSNGSTTALEENVNEVKVQNTQIKGQECHLDKSQMHENLISATKALQNNKSQLNDKRDEEKCTKGSTKCIFTQGSSTKEHEKKPTPIENPKALHEDQGKGSHGSMIKEDSGFKKDSEKPSPLGEKHKKRRKTRQEKKQAAVLLVKFRGELDHEKLFLKCYYGIPCSGTKKWTGGVEGLLLYKGVKKETPNGKIYECVEEKSWFAMIIRNWTEADIFSQYKCWNKFKEHSVILNEQPILYKTSDDSAIRCNGENEEMTMLTMNVTVLHTSQHPSFTYVTEVSNNSKFTQESTAYCGVVLLTCSQ
ncbi:unnamed protein product [Mytilus coruscus]|uniref:Uncharacterized protein n=1 Tax=Mytilus coruscus TaxID=42192 RepID=A0A6J8CDK4_MYTCO|nr:unnamed protein product [Mytilus coruscus]